MKRLGLKVIAVVLASYAASAPAFANTNFLYPVSGSAFAPFGNPANGNLFLQNGAIFNISGGPVVVEASLGHSAGGSYSWTIHAFGNSANGPTSTFNCTLFATRDGIPSTQGIQSFTFNASAPITAGRVMAFLISANLPSGAYSYTLQCLIPPSVGNAAAITAVTPNQ